MQIDIGKDGVPEWPSDWGGNLHLFREEIKIDKVSSSAGLELDITPYLHILNDINNQNKSKNQIRRSRNRSMSTFSKIGRS